MVTFQANYIKTMKHFVQHSKINKSLLLLKLQFWQDNCRIEKIMSEMLGNQYFLARKYSLAATELEKALLKEPTNKCIRRKLIICNIQKGNINRALELFVSLIEEDIYFIIDADPIRDDCPCPELVYDLETQIEDYKHTLDYNLKLGMIWLFCDIKKSIHYFNECQRLDTENHFVKKILSYLSLNLLEKEPV
jgi:hypothetical protein